MRLLNLREMIEELSEHHGLIMLKGGTEWEDMDYSEIEILNSFSDPTTPLLIKVAGQEARVDIRKMMDIGVGGLLAPMIESEYALKKFVMTVCEIYKSFDNMPTLAINIETKCGVENLKSILDSPYRDFVESIVIGRLDLSTSLGKNNVDDSAVSAVIKTITAQTEKRGIKVSIGGFVNPQSAMKIQQIYKVDRINTIHTMFDLNKTSDINKSIKCGLEFEIELYNTFKNNNPHRTAFYDTRIAITQKKLNQGNRS